MGSIPKVIRVDTGAMVVRDNRELLLRDHQSVNHHIVHALCCDSDCCGCVWIHSGCSNDDWSSIEKSHQSYIEQ